MRAKETYDQVPIRACNLKVDDIFLHQGTTYIVLHVTRFFIRYTQKRKRKQGTFCGYDDIMKFGAKSQQFVTLIW